MLFLKLYNCVCFVENNICLGLRIGHQYFIRVRKFIFSSPILLSISNGFFLFFLLLTLERFPSSREMQIGHQGRGDSFIPQESPRGMSHTHSLSNFSSWCWKATCLVTHIFWENWGIKEETTGTGEMLLESLFTIEFSHEKDDEYVSHHRNNSKYFFIMEPHLKWKT